MGMCFKSAECLETSVCRMDGIARLTPRQLAPPAVDLLTCLMVMNTLWWRQSQQLDRFLSLSMLWTAWWVTRPVRITFQTHNQGCISRGSTVLLEITFQTLFIANIVEGCSIILFWILHIGLFVWIDLYYSQSDGPTYRLFRHSQTCGSGSHSYSTFKQ